ncbi:MAG: nucleotidyltransferase domain-containing protein [Planctomycetota bacterium]|nr:nucleotidyltransferase domain-containing protein [Planctomycetota bacterium]
MNPIPKPIEKIDLTPITGLLDYLRSRYSPSQLWLFGSRARGTNRDDSDWDLLVVLPNDREADVDALSPSKVRKDTAVNVDLVACTEEDFEIGSRIPNTLAFEIRLTGIPIHER